MSQTERENEEERRVLAVMDAADDTAWRAMVRYFAPTLCQQNPKLLAEIVIRRGMAAAKDREKWQDPGVIDRAEVIAQQFGLVGLNLVVA